MTFALQFEACRSRSFAGPGSVARGNRIGRTSWRGMGRAAANNREAGNNTIDCFMIVLPCSLTASSQAIGSIVSRGQWSGLHCDDVPRLSASARHAAPTSSHRRRALAYERRRVPEMRLPSFKTCLHIGHFKPAHIIALVDLDEAQGNPLDAPCVAVRHRRLDFVLACHVAFEHDPGKSTCLCVTIFLLFRANGEVGPHFKPARMGT
jgi:hypothetical protein